MYTYEKFTANKIYWRCDNRQCSARLHTSGDTVVRQPTEHRLHAPSAERILAAKTAEEVKKKAVECESSTRNVVHQALSQVPLAAVPAVPSTSALSQIVGRKRRKLLEVDENSSGEEGETAASIPRKLRTTTDNQNY